MIKAARRMLMNEYGLAKRESIFTDVSDSTTFLLSLDCEVVSTPGYNDGLY